MKYQAITTDSGTEFEVGIKSITLIQDKIVKGSLVEAVEIFKKNELHAIVGYDKIEIFYFTK